jgi:cytochrome P450
VAFQPTVDYNPFAPPDLDDPHPTLRRAREGTPVFFSEALHTWVVTRHDDVCTILGDPVRFSSGAAITNVPTPPPPPILAVLSKGIPYEGGMVDMDPPAHSTFQRLFNRAFTPRRLSAMNPRIAQIVGELVGAFAARGTGDLVAQVAYPLPMRVIAGIFGVPEADMGDFKRWSDQWLILLSQRGSMDELVTAAENVVAFQHYIHDFLEERRANPGDDLTGDLFRAVAELEDPPSTDALVGVVMTILFAGHETTTTLIGNAVRLLLEHPEQLEELRADSSLLPGAITETLRYDPPVPSMYRTTTCEVDVRDVKLPEGAHLQLSFVSANRDPFVFPDPDVFDIHRPKDQPILSFGRGIHFCIGAALAQAEAQQALREIIALKNLRFVPDRPVHFIQSATVRANESIWLEWDR